MLFQMQIHRLRSQPKTRTERTTQLSSPVLNPVALQENMPPLVGFLLLSAFCFPRSFFLAGASSRLCSHQCNCYEHAELVDCRGRGFEHVPRGVPHGTWLLELGGNNLSQIGSHAFIGLWSLRVLMLSNSQIQEIQPLVGMSKHCLFF